MTIAIGLMKSSYDNAKMILKKYNIPFEENIIKVQKDFKNSYSEEFKKTSLVGNSIEIYEKAIEFQDYNLFLPEDGSIFQFSIDGRSIRFAYFERPYNSVTYQEFLKFSDISYEECGDMFYEEYNQYLIESPQKEHITNFRYDYSEIEYHEVIHPVSHLHIGQNNNVRIPLSKILLPSSFVMFIIKQVYWEKFKEYSQNNISFIDDYISEINKVKDIPQKYLTSRGLKELILTLNGR
ncbi:DUF2290 domain-containing protein [Streptococcus parasanguinis]|jgi:hypothetical protein|uniref:DUF2290 domain-containing protein n=1 Tax=Streptococcus parasanguinis TaxID=1318 RepID=UPI0018AB2359|nr:DUF2290 domain-containing protein [Streptococcus parasanguinis]